MSGSTLSEQASIAVYEEHADASLTLPGFLRRFDKETRADYLRDVVHQNLYHPQQHELYTMVRIYHRIRSGEFAGVRIKVGSAPFRDSALDQNTAMLAKLPHPFRAEVWNGMHKECDGRVVWDDPLVMDVVSDYNSWELKSITIPPGSVPLEIGFCRPFVLWRHMIPQACDAGFARWPYGHQDIYLYTRVPGCPC